VLYEILNYAKDGRPYWNAVEAQPLRDEQADLGLVGMLTEPVRQSQLRGLAWVRPWGARAAAGGRSRAGNAAP